MNVSSQIRHRVFEVAVFLTIVVLPSTAIVLNRIDSELAQKRQQVEELSRRQDDYFRDEYLKIADQIETQVNELQDLLTNAVMAGSSSFSFEVRATPLSQWLESQMARPDWESLPNQQLRERIARDQSGSTNGALLVHSDLKPLLSDIKRSFGNYLASARSALRGSRDQAAEKADSQVKVDLDKAAESARHLLALAGEARRSGEVIAAFLKNQKPVSPPSNTLRYLLLGGLAGLFILMLLVFRCFVTSQLQVELTRKNVELEHQQQLGHFGQLAAGLAHEIRNPLTAISARLYTLQKTLSEGTPEHKDASVIRDEVHRMDRIVQDFLTLARPANPKLAPLTADPLLKQLCDLLAPQYDPLSIELKVDSIDPVRFRADAQQLKQVLINLIRNAGESMQQGGRVTLRARREKTKLKDRVQDVAVIEVEDTGAGIPPEVQERLFTPFFSTKDGGTGLGLAIAARIVNKHGGELKFETHLNHGTIFRIILPAYDQAS